MHEVKVRGCEYTGYTVCAVVQRVLIRHFPLRSGDFLGDLEGLSLSTAPEVSFQAPPSSGGRPPIDLDDLAGDPSLDPHVSPPRNYPSVISAYPD